MEKLILDSKNTLVNLGNSILGYFEVPKFHDSLKIADEILNKAKKRKVALILLDGMGQIIYEKYKEYIPYLYSHIIAPFKSVYPPTTVAATTALTTGKYPIETSYLGWTQYFKTKDAYINVFPSTDAINAGVTYTPPVTEVELKVNKIWDLINKLGKYKATSISSFQFRRPEGGDDFDLFFNKANELIKENDFTYIYSGNPDHLLHEFGTNDEHIKENLIYLNKKVQELVENNSDTLFFLTADHGFADVIEIPVTEHEDFLDTLSVPVCSIEGRFATFSVKNKEKFIELANKYYGENFIIKSKEEILNEHTFGYGEINKNSLDVIKDYTLIAKGKYIFYNGPEPIGFKGAHAGATKGETDIYLVAFNDWSLIALSFFFWYITSIKAIMVKITKSGIPIPKSKAMLPFPILQLSYTSFTSLL